MTRRWLPILLLLAPSLAQADALPVDQIVARARAVWQKHPHNTVCRIHVETQLYDKGGKLEHQEIRDGKATLHGNDQEVDTERATRDGKPMSDEELRTEREKLKKQRAHKKDDAASLLPLAPENAAAQKFALLRQETLWGRPAYVLSVRADGEGDTLAHGTLWIDAERFVELKGELSPVKMPPHADWVKVQEQFRLDAGGTPLPTLLDIQGAGHMFFVHKQFRSTLRWSDCQ